MIVYCCRDLIFSTKIHSTAEAMGVACRPTRDLAALDDRLNQVNDGKLNEAVTGILIDLEMGNEGLELLERVKTHTPTIPVVAFGPHTATTMLQQAHNHGADFVMPRSQFTANLPSILERFGGNTL